MKSKNEFLHVLRGLKHPKPCQEAIDWIQDQPVKTVKELIERCDKAHWLCFATERLKPAQFAAWAKTGDAHSVYLTAFMAYAYASSGDYYAKLHEQMLAELKAIWLET